MTPTICHSNEQDYASLRTNSSYSLCNGTLNSNYIPPRLFNHTPSNHTLTLNTNLSDFSSEIKPFRNEFYLYNQ